MTDLEDRLPAALSALAGQAPHDDHLAGDVRRAGRRRRLMMVGPITAAVAVCAVVGVVWVSAARSPSRITDGANPVPGTTCQPLSTAPLPIWARAGFSGDGSGVPWTLSAGGTVAAIVFGNPLNAPPSEDHNNKILWVVNGDVPVVVPSTGSAGGGSQNLIIKGHLEGTDVTTTIDTGAAPGPSIVDMPAAGCWHLDLSWGGRSDSIDLKWSTP
jgi:hypothetical protein